MKSFKEYITEGKKFHPIDVFQDRWVITDGKEIMSPETGEVRTIKQFRDDMQKIKQHDQYDDIYFPTEKMANDAAKEMKDKGKFKVKKLSYA